MPRTCSKCGRSGHNRRSCMEKVKDLTPTHGTVYTYLVDENNKKPEYMNLRECSGTDVAKKSGKSRRAIDCDVCTLCYEPLTETNKLIGICGHQFHANCMVKNLQYSNKCPICCDNVLWVLIYLYKVYFTFFLQYYMIKKLNRLWRFVKGVVSA